MSDKYLIKQDDMKDCGVCCLLSIIRFYKGNISREYLKEITKTDRNGVNALNIIKASRKIGFEAYGIKCNVNDLHKYILPLIAHIVVDKKYGHFVVIYKIDKKNSRIFIMDPSKGFLWISIDDFKKISSNYFLILKNKQQIPNLRDNNNIYNNIKHFLYQYKRVWIIILIMSLASVLLSIIISYNYKYFFDEVNITSIIDLKKLFLVITFMSIFQLFVILLRDYFINHLNFLLDNVLVKKAYYHIINLPYLYYKNHTNGDLLNRINDLANVKELVSRFFVSILIDLVLALFIVIILFKNNLKFTIVTLLSLIAYSVVTFVFNRFIKNDIQKIYQKSADVNNYLIESLASFETIKNISLQNYVYNKFIIKYLDYTLLNRLSLSKLNIINFIKNTILVICNLIILYEGSLLMQNNNITITSLITYLSLSNYLINPIKNLLDLQLLYQNTKESLRRMKEIYSIKKEIDNKKNTLNLKGRLDINDVSYSYDGLNNIISNVSLHIKESEKILITGSSGIGKSTLMQLLIKYNGVNYKGNITIDGYDLKNIDLFSLRKNILYVSQNEYLFTDTIYENITLGKKIKYDFFLELCNNLFISEIVKNNSLGFNYLVENNGDNLSGGERSRLFIARSILRNPNIYIYDETFSNMDIEKERKILQYLFNLYPMKTFIIISHRASNIDLFNQVIDLEKGVKDEGKDLYK